MPPAGRAVLGLAGIGQERVAIAARAIAVGQVCLTQRALCHSCPSSSAQADRRHHYRSAAKRATLRIRSRIASAWPRRTSASGTLFLGQLVGVSLTSAPKERRVATDARLRPTHSQRYGQRYGQRRDHGSSWRSCIASGSVRGKHCDGRPLRGRPQGLWQADSPYRSITAPTSQMIPSNCDPDSKLRI